MSTKLTQAEEVHANAPMLSKTDQKALAVACRNAYNTGEKLADVVIATVDKAIKALPDTTPAHQLSGTIVATVTKTAAAGLQELDLPKGWNCEAYEDSNGKTQYRAAMRHVPLYISVTGKVQLSGTLRTYTYNAAKHLRGLFADCDDVAAAKAEYTAMGRERFQKVQAPAPEPKPVVIPDLPSGGLGKGADALLDDILLDLRALIGVDENGKARTKKAIEAIVKKAYPQMIEAIRKAS